MMVLACSMNHYVLQKSAHYISVIDVMMVSVFQIKDSVQTNKMVALTINNTNVIMVSVLKINYNVLQLSVKASNAKTDHVLKVKTNVLITHLVAQITHHLDALTDCVSTSIKIHAQSLVAFKKLQLNVMMVFVYFQAHIAVQE